MSNRLTNRVDAAGTTRYSYAMLGSGRRTMSESGLWATDTVTVTNRYGRRARLTIQQPSGTFAVTNAWDAAGRWNVVGGTAGTFEVAQNLSKRTNNTTVESFTVNALNQLTAIPDSAPTYDRRGNLTSRYFTGAP